MILSPLPKMQFLSAAGDPLVGGKLYTYLAGTTTPATTYTSSTGGATNTNPVILNSRGEADVWLAAGVQYKLVLKDSLDSTIWTVDNILPADASGSANWLTGVSGTSVISGTAAGAQITAYAAGQVFRFTAANTNIGITSLNVNSLGAKSITRIGTVPLVAGDIKAGEVCEVVYDGTQFQIINPSATFVSDTLRTRNRIVNGGMFIDQRNAGAVQSVASSTVGSALVYTLDRFYVSATSSSGSPSITVQRKTKSGSAITTSYAMQITGVANITNVVVGHRIESLECIDFANATTVAIGIWLSSSVTRDIGWALYAASTADSFGTIATPTRVAASSGVSSGTFSSVAAAMAFYSITVDVTSSLATNGLELVLSLGAVASGTVNIAQISLQADSAVSSFEYPVAAAEIARCQRFFCKTFDLETKPATNSSAPGTIGLYTQTANTTFGYGWRFPVPMRTTPATLTFYNPSAANANWSSGGVGVTTVDAGSTGVTLAGATPTISAGVRTSIHATADAEL